MSQTIDRMTNPFTSDDTQARLADWREALLSGRTRLGVCLDEDKAFVGARLESIEGEERRAAASASGIRYKG